jgi:hypothetical protein
MDNTELFVADPSAVRVSDHYSLQQLVAPQRLVAPA